MRILFFVVFSFVMTFAKQDFFYGFMDNSGKQIDLKTKKQIQNGFIILDNIRRSMNEGEVAEALKQIQEFEKSNKLPILKSDIVLLKSQILLRLESKRYVMDGEKLLENAINAGIIKEANLLDAYMTLARLKVNANKANEAKYFAQAIIDNFEDPLKKAYGNIVMAEIAIFQKDYPRATKMLYDILAKTNDISIATVVADKLFDVYLADHKPEKAYELIEKVLKTNIGYYINDVSFAIKKADQLIKVDMPELGILIFEEILKHTTNNQTIEKVKLKLADAYMSVIDLPKAKEYYKDLMTDFAGGPSAEKAKMAIDEILMREGKVEPAVIAERYKDSKVMQQKALFQELLNDKKENKYEQILKSKKIYNKIADQIAIRFGYSSVSDVYNDVQVALIKKLLAEGNCEELDKATREATTDVLKMLIQDEATKNSFFECVVEVPSVRIFEIADEAFKDSRDSEVYLYLEKIAFGLEDYENSLAYSQKVAMVNNKTVLEKEFIQKFLLAKTLGDQKLLTALLESAVQNPNYIEANKNNPVILDFYGDFYLYLLEQNKQTMADAIVTKMYAIKKAKKIRTYSPMVEMAIADMHKGKKNYKLQISTLEEAIKNSRKIKPNDLARIYYDLAKGYQSLKQKSAADEYIQKCKKITDEASIWKKMCDKL